MPSPILTINKVNDIVASLIGIGANLLLLWFMYSAKKLEMKPVTKVLTQGCIIDLTIALTTIVTQPVSLQIQEKP